MPKLAPRRHGPFKIIQVMSTVNYRLELPTQWSIHPVFHIDLLTPYKETITHGANYQRPPPDLVDNEEEYEVETILDLRLFGRCKHLQYLVKWKGYPDSDNMWVDKDDIFTEDKVWEFKRLNPATKTHIRHCLDEGMSHSPSSTSSYFTPHILSMSSDAASDLTPKYPAGAYADSPPPRPLSDKARELVDALRWMHIHTPAQPDPEPTPLTFEVSFADATVARNGNGSSVAAGPVDHSTRTDAGEESTEGSRRNAPSLEREALGFCDQCDGPREYCHGHDPLPIPAPQTPLLAPSPARPELQLASVHLSHNEATALVAQLGAALNAVSQDTTPILPAYPGVEERKAPQGVGVRRGRCRGQA